MAENKYNDLEIEEVIFKKEEEKKSDIGTAIDKLTYHYVVFCKGGEIFADDGKDINLILGMMKDGYDTMLVRAGENLSQGQRQLLAIARAAIADCPVLILDEATSSIDTRTELIVQKGMDELMNGRTTFVIAHRLSTIQTCNAIMVMDHGRIIERGNHKELIEKKGVYYSLYTGKFEFE